MDCELQYHARMDLPGKHAKAVKRMSECPHCREIRGAVPNGASTLLFNSARICADMLCRRGTAPMHVSGAGLFQHISGI